MLNHAGLAVIAVTNQSGVGRGYFTEELVRQAHRKIASQLAAQGARVDAFYYCPHHPTAPVRAYRVDCGCRKPAPGMVEKAVRRFHIDLKSSYMVGDSYRDMQLGFNVGARTALVMTGYGRGEYEYHRRQWQRMPDLIAENLLEVVKQILADPARAKPRRAPRPVPGTKPARVRSGRCGRALKDMKIAPSDRSALLSAIEQFPTQKIVMLGDLVADEFIYGEIARVSREAPVLILKQREKQIIPGGGANAAHNLADLGAQVIPAGVVGDDEAGEGLLRYFNQKKIPTRLIVRVRGHVTPTKSRILGGLLHWQRQQIVRIDREPARFLGREIRRRLSARVAPLLRTASALLISDYGYGTTDAEELNFLRRRARRPSLPVTVDSRFDLLSYSHATAATPNEPEIETAFNRRIGSDRDLLHRLGRRVLSKQAFKALLVTRGRDGMVLFQPHREPVHLPIFGSDQAVDVTGAGDTVIAAFTLALAAGASFYHAAQLANCAGGLVVMKRGTATVTARELTEAIRKA